MLKNIQNSKSTIADLGLLYASAIWGTTFFIVKAVVKHIDPFTLCAYRFLFAGIILMFILLYQQKNIFSNLKEGLVLGLFVWLIYISQTIGLVYTSASNAAFITGLFVAFVPLFSFLLFKKVSSLNRVIAVLIALYGLWVLTGGLKEINKGDLITLITAIAYALHILFADNYVKKDIDPYVLCFQQFMFVSLLSFIYGIFFKVNFSISNLNILWVILFLTIFPTVSAFLIQLVSQKITTPVKVSLIFALEPVFGALFAWTIGGEIFILSRAVGGLLIFIAIIIAEVKLDFSILRFSFNKTNQ